MKTTVRHILVAGALTVTAAAQAQHTESGYFLDDYIFRFQSNPAMANSRSFISIPALGNINAGCSGTLNLSDVIYVVDGKTTTFLNPKLSASEVLSNIGDRNRFGFDVNAPVFATGFTAFNGYNTISLSVRGSSALHVPGALFSFLKEGVANKSYDIGSIDAYARAYVELSVGHSRQITKEWRVGANVKVLIGAGNVSIDMKQASLSLGADEWTIESEGQINANLKDFKYETKVNDNTGHRYVSGADYDGDNVGVSGYGLAVDLGAVYKPAFLPDFEFSAAILDFGGISWSNDVLATTNGVKRFTSSKYTFNADDNAPNSFDNEIDKIKDDFSALYELDDAGDQGSRFTMLGTTLNLGAKYTLPMYRRVAFGLLNTTRIQGDYSWTDFRASANYTPCRIFDMSLSASVGTFGLGWGWLANLHCPGFNIFCGADRMTGKLSKQGLPLNSNMSVNFGLNLLF